MWLCTCPAYDTVHMRSFNVRLYMNSGQLSCSFSHKRMISSIGDYNCSTRALGKISSREFTVWVCEHCPCKHHTELQTWLFWKETKTRHSFSFLNQRQVQRCVVVKTTDYTSSKFCVFSAGLVSIIWNIWRVYTWPQIPPPILTFNIFHMLFSKQANTLSYNRKYNVMTTTDKSLLFKNKEMIHMRANIRTDVQFTHKHTVCNSTLLDTVPKREEGGWRCKTWGLLGPIWGQIEG